MTTPRMKTFHHLTRLFVLSAVLRWVRSRTTMYDCSSLTWARSSDSFLTVWSISLLSISRHFEQGRSYPQPREDQTGYPTRTRKLYRAR